MHIELRAGLEASRLMRRDFTKYRDGISGLYLASLAGCDLGQTARTSYFFLRHIDDVLDGDRTDIPDDPFAYVTRVRELVESGSTSSDIPITDLANRAIELLEKKARPGDDPRQDFLGSIDSILFDYSRSQERLALANNELDNYYQRTFSPVINIMLIGVSSSFRATDLPELSSTQGKVYAFRDFKEDWERGTINIPSEVLESASLTTYDTYEDVITNQGIASWRSQVYSESLDELDLVEFRIKQSDEWLTQRICGGLIRNMRDYITVEQDVSSKAAQG